MQGFIISHYEGHAAHHGWLLQRQCCLSCPCPHGARGSPAPPCCMVCPQEHPGHPSGLAQLFAGRCCQVFPASPGLGSVIPIFVLEDSLSCKSKWHFYYFQLLHDSYYSSALTSAINNNRIVNYCSF